MPSCTFVGPRKACRAPIPSGATRCGPCASCSGSRIPGRRSCSPASGGRRSRRQALRAWWSALVSRPRKAFRLILTCYATPVALRWPTRATIRAPCKPISATRTFSTRYATPNCRPVASRSYQSTISNASRQRTTRPVDGEGKCAVQKSVGVSQKRPNSSRRDCPACPES